MPERTPLRGESICKLNFCLKNVVVLEITLCQTLINLEMCRGKVMFLFRRWLSKRLIHLANGILVYRDLMSRLAKDLFFILMLLILLRSEQVIANGPGDLGSIRGHVIPKTLKMALDTSLLNTQQYKVCIDGKVEKYRERSSALPYTLV